MAGPDDSAYGSNPYGNPDPTELYQHLMDTAGPQGGAMSGMARNALAGGFNPVMQHAQMVQKNLASILQSTQPEEGEDPLDTQIRQAKAVSLGMMKVDPTTAIRANQQVIRLQEAKNQQAELQAKTADEAQQARSRKMANDAARTVITNQQQENVNGLPFRSTRSLGVLNPNDADYAQQMQKILLANPGAVPMSSDDYVKALAADNQNRAMAMMYGTANRIAASAANQGEVPYAQMSDADKDVAGFSKILGIQQPADLQRKGQIRIAEKVQSGELDMGDVADAPAQYQALKRSTQAAANRAGNIKSLSDSLKGLGKNVKDALAEAERVGAGEGDFRMVNAAVQWGDKNFMVGDNSEKAVALRKLYTAMNELVYEHGRLLSGGGARTNVAAVKDARQNMTVSDNPEVVRGAVDQIVNQALPVIEHANQYALEALSNPKAYPAVAKMMKAFGGANFMGTGPDQSVTAEQAPPSQNPTGPNPNAAPAAPPAASTPTSQYRHLFLRNPNGGK